jgi:hypothetical protein
MIHLGFIAELSSELRWLVGIYLLISSIGFYSGISFVDHTTEGKPSGIIENYNGNEDNLEAEVMKFKKSEHEMYNILHTHFISMSILFLILSFLVYGIKASKKLIRFLMIEPLLSVLFTFGGIFLLWKGLPEMVYIVIISGVLMTLSYSFAVFLIYYNLFFNHSISTSN